ncbi:hypothetical protein LT493_13265 [Streptomyces tricolor]|nr:hypothetical protein [Streptomyces tricolor]
MSARATGTTCSDARPLDGHARAGAERGPEVGSPTGSALLNGGRAVVERTSRVRPARGDASGRPHGRGRPPRSGADDPEGGPGGRHQHRSGQGSAVPARSGLRPVDRAADLHAGRPADRPDPLRGRARPPDRADLDRGRRRHPRGGPAARGTRPGRLGHRPGALPGRQAARLHPDLAGRRGGGRGAQPHPHRGRRHRRDHRRDHPAGRPAAGPGRPAHLVR